MRRCILAIAVVVATAIAPSTSRADDPVPFCEVVKGFSGFLDLFDVAGTMRGSDDGSKCPKSKPAEPDPTHTPPPRPGSPANPPGWNPRPGQFEALH